MVPGTVFRFRSLHEGEPFLFPNPWDAGSARMLEELGFTALATTSSGFAFTLGRADGQVTLDEVVAHTKLLADAVSIPVAVDLENGYGRPPAEAARAVRAAAEAGAAGGSIEDYDHAADLVYPLEEAVERIAVAAEAAAETGFVLAHLEGGRSSRRRRDLSSRRRRHLSSEGKAARHRLASLGTA